MMTGDEFREYMQSDNWRKVAQAVKERDRVCQCCDTGSAEVAHHLSYWAINHDGKDDPDLILAVCHDCHDYIHQKGKYDVTTATE